MSVSVCSGEYVDGQQHRTFDLMQRRWVWFQRFSYPDPEQRCFYETPTAPRQQYIDMDVSIYININISVACVCNTGDTYPVLYGVRLNLKLTLFTYFSPSCHCFCELQCIFIPPLIRIQNSALRVMSQRLLPKKEIVILITRPTFHRFCCDWPCPRKNPSVSISLSISVCIRDTTYISFSLFVIAGVSERRGRRAVLQRHLCPVLPARRWAETDVIGRSFHLFIDRRIFIYL